MKIIKMLEDIARLDSKIAKIKNGTDEATNKKTKKLLNDFYKIFNIDAFVNDIIIKMKAE